MSNNTTLAQARAPQSSGLVNAGFFDLQGFELMQRVSKAFSSSSLVPTQYQNNLPNCMIAMDMAQRIGANPLMVMQNLYIVHGTPGWSSKFLIATINTCGRYSTLRYEWRGKPGDSDYGCRAWAIERATNERLEGIWVDWKMVNAEGWASKNGSKWKTMPDQMFIYRAAAFWQRAYAPELGMGLQTTEEIHDVIDAGMSPDGTIEVDVNALRAAPADKPKRTKQETPAATDAEFKQSTNVDQDTGEVLNATGAEVYVDRRKVSAEMMHAKDHDALAVAADQIKDTEPEYHDDLNALYRQRLDELDGVQHIPEETKPAAATRARRTANAE